MDDKELDDLLESALDDFGKDLKIEASTLPSGQDRGKVTIEKTQLYVDDVDYDDRPTSSSKAATGSSKQPMAASNKPSRGEEEEQMKLFDEIFNDAKTRETMKQFTQALSGLKEGGDEAKLMENFTQMMSQLANETNQDDDDESDLADLDVEALGKKFEGLDFLKKLTEATVPLSSSKKEKSTTNTAKNDEEAATPAGAAASSDEGPKTQMDKVLEDLTRNSDKVLNDTGSSAAASFSTLFSRLTSSLDDDSSSGASGDDIDMGASSSSMMEPLLSMLFSKDILYPSLKLMLENFDKYIEERKEKLTEEEVKKCREQKECIGEMCRVYESMKDEDSSEVKSENLRKILDLLEKCGMPPNELVPEVNPFDILENQAKPQGCPIS